jgi:hypothetical protein
MIINLVCCTFLPKDSASVLSCHYCLVSIKLLTVTFPNQPNTRLLYPLFKSGLD